MLVKLVVLLTILGAAFLSAQVHVPRWTYDGVGGPAPHLWHLDWPMCNGTMQSPINIDNNRTMFRNIGRLVYNMYHTTPSYFNISNNGRTIRVRGDFSDHSLEVPLLGTYRPVFFDFNWGSNNNQGSEHHIDNVTYPLEVQIYHQSVNYSNFDHALRNRSGILIVALLYKLSCDSPMVDHLVEHFVDIRRPGESKMISGFPLQTLLQYNNAVYYQYEGSYPEPPCSHNVTWIVYRDAISVSKCQMRWFRSLCSNSNCTTRLQDNFRPIQPFHDHMIWRSM